MKHLDVRQMGSERGAANVESDVGPRPVSARELALENALRRVRALWRDHTPRHTPGCPLDHKPCPIGPCRCEVGKAADEADEALKMERGR